MKIYKILIVDDVLDNINVISSALENADTNYTLYQALNGDNAFNIAEKRQPDLIITDWDMPNMSGIDLIKKIKSYEATKDIPIIMATGVMLSSNDLRIALEAGANDYIRKPIDKVELTSRVRSVLELDNYKKQIIETKNKELTENTLFLLRNNKFNIKIKKQLSILSIPKKEESIVNKIIEEISDKIQTDSWYRFNLAFDTLHNDFKINLLSKYTNLTKSEIKLCSLLKLELSNQDIAIATYQTIESVRVARTRLFKKIRKTDGDTLLSILSAF